MNPAVIVSALALAAGSPTIPDSLRELLDGKDKAGKPIVEDAERNYLLQLPQHTIDLFGKAAENMYVSRPEHLQMLLSLKLDPQKAELVLQDNCILCHTDASNVKKDFLFSKDPKASGSPEHLNLTELLSDVHFRKGLSCSGCHGGTPADEFMTKGVAERWPKRDERLKDRSWIPGFCGRCHSDPSFMRGFNPMMPTDQVAKYRESQHGIRLFEAKDPNVATCISCHGVHGIRGPKSRLSKVYPQNIPGTCGACHANATTMASYKLADGSPIPTTQLEEYKSSVHGRALLEKGDMGAPACNGCHGNHAAMPPKVASVAQVCRTCHSQNGTYFDGSKHKAAFAEHGWPECAKCHGKHNIAKTSDTMIGDGVKQLCGACHAQFSKDDPECNATARHFRDSLDELSRASAELSPQIQRVAERGLDDGPLAAAVGELGEALTQTRTRVHTFDRSRFDESAAAGRTAVAKGQAAIEESVREYRFRRNGLLGAIGMISLLGVSLALKIRQIDRRRE
jgi:hypothetical protein